MKLKLYDSENNFCGILWEKGPLGRRELMDLCRVRLGWKGSVTRTAIRRMVKRGAVQVEDGVVSMRVGREDTEVTTKWCLFDLLHGSSAGMTGNTAAAIRGDKMGLTEAAGVRRMMDRHITSGNSAGEHYSAH